MLALKKLGIEIEFQGKGINEKGVVVDNKKSAKVKIGQEIIKIDSRYYRPSEVENLLGDPSYARNELGWEPNYSIDQIVDEMLENDLNLHKPTS